MAQAGRTRRDAFFEKLGSTSLVMGILNLTPDSFSDGGLYQAADAATAHAAAMAGAGAAIIDIGAESTRPASIPVGEQEELSRLEGVLEAIAGAVQVPISIDTSKAAIARYALAHGAIVVNDVWGLQRDRAMAATIAEAQAGVVIMHNRHEMVEDLDILSDMRAFFDRSLDIALDAGIPATRTLLDPGIGFGKTARQNLVAIANVGSLVADYGLPVLVGVSRKKFLRGIVDGGIEGDPAGTLAVNLAARAAGASVFRVHDVAAHVAALTVFDTVRRAAW